MFVPRTVISALAFAMMASTFPTSVDTSSVVPTSTAVPTASGATTPAGIHPHSFEVYDPPITQPTADTVWTTGSSQTVKWDISKIGSDGSNTTASLLLGHKDPGSSNEFLDIKNPLAVNVPVSAGQVTITVPDDVLTDNNYIVVLVGSISDSGNASPVFTIQNPSQSSLTSLPTPTPSGSSVPMSPAPSVTSVSDPAASATSVPTDVRSSVPVDTASSSASALPTSL
ncbi:uncharacterized protein PHACADRAFT_262236 [Phanerochaete carnosa HHB-10118-sp]|uniref:Yeast cell wall synthesis Kre9/Knh1-like N-terminal domain-containing protein n=1 Tax=Phanerochaete carnosa (strain HHB-10118-sp) TaxID=650164 RepID=K5VYI6_PHACS|nr:uncharacterized protein PHACADRAFT_262236 [Phanerochaete carnosa HHB-10118-sp]EKM51855.1 hypothetical protein PHACADRAFT_262236 [Phanerochaete carnosa HHB-10118-sp]